MYSVCSVVCLSHCVCVYVCVTAVFTNRLGSSLPLGSEYVPLETWVLGRRGATSSHVKNLTAQTWRSTRGWSFSSLTQPHRPLRTPRSSWCRLQVYRFVCVWTKRMTYETFTCSHCGLPCFTYLLRRVDRKLQMLLYFNWLSKNVLKFKVSVGVYESYTFKPVEY